MCARGLHEVAGDLDFVFACKNERFKQIEIDTRNNYERKLCMILVKISLFSDYFKKKVLEETYLRSL